MKVGISQLVGGGLDMDAFLAAAEGSGYEVVELALRREGDLTPDMDDAALAKIKAAAEGHGLEIVSLTLGHTTGNLLASGEEQERSVAETKRGLEVAQALGARCALHTLGRITPELYYDDAYANGVAALQALAPVAEATGVAIAVEFVWNGFLFSPLEMKRFLEAAGSDQVGFYFDPGNMAVFQYPQHWVRILAHQLKMVHLKDWQGRALNGGWTALTEGEVDFPAVMRELRAAGYDGPLISEVSKDLAAWDATAQAIRTIMTL